jgi:GAF domain-containing protein
MSTIIVAFITGVLGPVLVMVVKHFIDKKSKKKDMIADACEVSSAVVLKLDEIKEEYSADRVWIAQFHNGGHFYPTGKSIAKFSVFYETVEAGASSIQTNLQNIPVNLFSKSINYLLKDEMIRIADFKDETLATYGLKYFAEENGTKSQYLFSIRSLDGKFIGFMSVDYTKKKTRLTDQDIIDLEIVAGTLGGVLMNHLTR